MTLELIKALESGQTPELLKSQLGIEYYCHSTLPLIGFKYHQLNSPKTHPIVREARGVVLEQGTWRLVAKGFNRFFNYGENQDEFASFDWSNFNALMKHDGSLFLLYYYDGWRVNTSGSFGEGKIHKTSLIWKDLFWSLAKSIKVNLLDKNCTYVFELCTLTNKVVKAYPEPTLYLLSVFENNFDSSQEFSEEATDEVARLHDLQRPDRFAFTSEKQAKDLVVAYNSGDTVIEGLVIRDRKNLRYKWKTDRYVALHNLLSNGALYFPDRLVNIARSGESSEVTTYFPEIIEPLEKVSLFLNKEFEKLYQLWLKYSHLSVKKDFALSIKDADCPTKGLLFNLWTARETDSSVDLKLNLKEFWNQIEAKKMVSLYPELVNLVDSLSESW